MQKASFLPLIIVLAVVVGGLLYLYGGAAFHQIPVDATSQAIKPQPNDPANVTVIAEGQNAQGVEERVNYRITDSDQLAMLWEMLYGDQGQPLPKVDFAKEEVLAIFDGTHSTGGYGVRIESVKDIDGQRTIAIVRMQPGDACSTSGESTNPFEVVRIKKSLLPLTHTDRTQVTSC